MKGGAMVAEALRREGVDSVFCFPANPLIDSIAEADIRTIVCRQERVGVNMADGFSRASRGQRIGVFVMQWGPGAENSYAGVAQAYANGIPMLLLPGARDSRRLDVQPSFWAARNFAGVTKWCSTIPSTDRIADLMRRAFFELRTGRPGPVLLEVPHDVIAEESEGSFDYVPATRGVKSMADPAEIREAAGALLKAKAPMIHAGQGILLAGATDELMELAELLQIPVMTTLPGKSGFPENHPLALGSGGSTTTGPVAHFVQKADVVLGIGTSFTRTPFGVTIPPGKLMIHATNNEWDINKDYPADIALLGDAKLVLRQLIDEAKARGRRTDGSDLPLEINAVKEAWLAEWIPHLTSDEVPLSPYRVIWELMHTVDRRSTIITHDSGGPRNQIVPFWEAIAPGSYIGWGKSTQLGFSLGAIMGAKLAAPEKLCINLMGDAAIGMTGMDFETAVRSQIPILLVVLNNGTMAAEIRSTGIASERFDALRQGGDYSAVAKALGGWSERVTTPDGIVPAIKRAIKMTDSGVPAMLEFITKAETAVSAPLAELRR
ncbi:MAG: thiamine pyrophosphate-requiring protein [Chloroflexi bacterium]|nr:thiamine pyrophosphate-requiring protein [Chloroflexota bacterium]